MWSSQLRSPPSKKARPGLSGGRQSTAGLHTSDLSSTSCGISRKDVQWHSGLPEGLVEGVVVECRAPADWPGAPGQAPASPVTASSVESWVVKWLLCWVILVMSCERRPLC